MKRIIEGQWTSSIYSLIAEKKYTEAVDLLQPQLEFFPNNRAALSLLAYCFYNLQDYNAASACYEKLVRAHPEVIDYKVNLAQSLHKAGNYAESAKAIVAVNDPQFTHRVRLVF